ncbi:inorganic phosphate transporter (predicted) [Purpureocillium lilacinum]|uniref:Inorganic phosphate transporter (Predicted) n=1 Tax=Purpureocillium lilacinum TaxID=33203 RepID=A0A179GIH9_PURLI|nr:inorganic phosphate transporter (predicted) [Purpureocillium lilacinum]OAQ76909.1 inorganic phosphate transporter (predicted) [Purpureocillium lilacinum]
MATFWHRAKFTVVAGAGFFTDGYINLTIGLVVPVLGYLYFEDDGSSVPASSSDIMKGSLSLGMIVGQIGFGLLGDTWGRRTVYGKELIITLFGTLMVIVLPWKHFSPEAVTTWVSVFRVVSGVGIGADYPLSSALSAENRSLGSRAVQVLTVFSFIGIGNYFASIIFIILLSAFKSSVLSDIRTLEWVWRLQLGIGMIPAAITLYSRLTMPETAPYKEYVTNKSAGDSAQDRGLRQQMQEFCDYFKEWRHAKVLLATSMAWFLFDIAYYGINLNQSIILSKIGYARGDDPWSTLWKIAVGNIIVQTAVHTDPSIQRLLVQQQSITDLDKGYLPGFFIGIPLADAIGRVRQQFYPSVAVCILYAIWAGISSPSVHTSSGGLLAMFALSQLLLCLGPNCTTFLLPSEVFPTRVRGTAHGISAAVGKSGAVLTAFAFGSITKRIGLSGVLGLFSGIMALTAAVTLLIPEPKNMSLADIERGAHLGDQPGDMDAGTAEAGDQTPDLKGTGFVRAVSL